MEPRAKCVAKTRRDLPCGEKIMWLDPERSTHAASFFLLPPFASLRTSARAHSTTLPSKHRLVCDEGDARRVVEIYRHFDVFGRSLRHDGRAGVGSSSRLVLSPLSVQRFLSQKAAKP